jgi:2-keto-4-pentenoate hydratase
MTVRASQRRQLAESLVAAGATRTPLAPFSEAIADLSVADAYRIQFETLRLRRRAGERRAGWRVGSAPGDPTPVAGYILASTVWMDGTELSRERFIAPGVDATIAIVLGRDLAGPGVTVIDVAGATAGVAAALETIDARFRDRKCPHADAVADNAFGAGVVLGGALHPLGALDLRLEGVTFELNGRVVATAAGAAASGHPLAAVAWLARMLAGAGLGLKAGDLVLTGGLTGLRDVQAGDVARAGFTRLGGVAARFV